MSEFNNVLPAVFSSPRIEVIVKTLIKVRNNLLSTRAASVLGPAQYSAYLAKAFSNIPKIIRAGDLGPLDKSMGATSKQFHYRGSTFFFDCQFCDEYLDENSFAFGIVREIYIRDCYFKWHPPSIYDTARTVIDLGANRGAFSTLMTTRAEFILSVECGEQYAPVIRHNMNKNNYAGYAIETAFIGSGGSTKSNAPRITFRDLFQRYNIESVDLIKMDIEGSEFALFESSEWLEHVGAISMEVHTQHGDPDAILKIINRYGFTYAVADENLQRTNHGNQASFIYAWKSA